MFVLRTTAQLLLLCIYLAATTGFMMGKAIPAVARVSKGRAQRMSRSQAARMSTTQFSPQTTVREHLPQQPAINCYPIYPRAAVNVVVVRGRPAGLGREYLFVLRSKEPGTNTWALPGGSVELGEPMIEAAARELVEETTLTHDVLDFYPRCFMTTDAIFHDESGAIKYHFVISQMLCYASPEAKPMAADDAKDIRWMTLPQIRKLRGQGLLFPRVVEVIETAERLVDAGCIPNNELVKVKVEMDDVTVVPLYAGMS